MKYSHLVIVSLSALLISACSNKELYEAIQENRVNDCRNLPYQKEQACLNNVNQQSYDDYNHKRGIEETSANKTHSDMTFSHKNGYHN